MNRRPGRPSSHDGSHYDEFEASELFCERCRQARPVRKRLLLVLPTGKKYDYVCAACGHSVGTKTDNDSSDFEIFLG
jgi:hypothetical protein